MWPQWPVGHLGTVLGLTLTLGLLTAGCHAPGPGTHRAARSAPAAPHAGITRQPPGTPSASSSVQATATPSPHPLRTPAPSAGGMSLRTFPRPGRLGAEWDYAVDPGNAEEGYLGNGTPALERDPGEVARTAVPLGCPRHGSPPTPQSALEVDYTRHTTKVIAIETRFGSTAQARSFFDARRSDLRACRGRVVNRAEGPLVGRVHGAGKDVLVSDRTPESPDAGWSEVAAVQGPSVLLLAARLGAGPAPLRSPRALVRRFHHPSAPDASRRSR